MPVIDTQGAETGLAFSLNRHGPVFARGQWQIEQAGCVGLFRDEVGRPFYVN